MKKIIITSILMLAFGTGANAATTPWWLQPTVCKLDPTDCYATMGAGYDVELWDVTSECWGMKLVCPDALVKFTDEPTPISKRDTRDSKVIDSDFDVNLLSPNGDCFGRRKTIEDGTMVSIDGKYVNVWCMGILDNADERTANGEITYGVQPKCATLAKNGYAAVKNNKCYGKYFDPNKYYIDCGADTLPTRIIVLNGADYTAPSTGAPVTKKDANKIFETMYSVSQEQKQKYFAQ